MTDLGLVRVPLFTNLRFRFRASRSRCIPGKKLWGDGYGFDGLKDSGGSHRHGFQRRGFNNSRW